MKAFITLSALALVSNIALADAFDYEKQFGSQDLDPSLGNASIVSNNSTVGNSTVKISLHEWYRGNPDVVAVDFHYNGPAPVAQKPLMTSLDIASKGNPDLDV